MKKVRFRTLRKAKVTTMENKKLFLSVSESDLKRIDDLRTELGMNRSEYIRYLLSGQKKVIPYSMKQRHLVEVLSQVDLHLKAICLKEGIEPKDVLYIQESLKDIKKEMIDGQTCGQSDHKWKEGEDRAKK